MFDGIKDFFKEMLSDGIMSMFNSFYISGSVDNAGGLLGESPSDFSFISLEMVENINTYVVLPIAGVILTYVMVADLIAIILDNNNMHEQSTLTIGRWLFRTCLAILFVSNAFSISVAIVEAGAEIARLAVPYATAENINITETLSESLEALSLSELMVTGLAAALSGVGMWLCQIMVWVVVITRFMSIYMNLSVASIPFATLTSTQLGNTGQNYLKNLIGIALQGLIIIVALAVYGAIGATPITIGDGIGIGAWLSAFFKPLILMVALVIVIVRSKSIANSIVGAY